MKILITTEFYLPLECGVTTAVINLRRGLETLGHEVRILTISGGNESYEEDGVYYIASKGKQLYQDSYYAINRNIPIVKDVIKWKPDIINSHCEFFTLHFAKKIAKKLSIPIVQTCHTDFESYGLHFMKSKGLWKFLVKTFVPLFIKKAAYVTCPSEKLYDLLKGYGVKNPLEIVPVGLDLNVFFQRLTAEERRILRTELKVNEDDTLFISVCRLSKEKKVDELIRLFNLINKDNPKTKLLIVGGGEEEANLRTIASTNPAISFTGRIPSSDIWKYYQAGDIMASASESETLGLTNVEALASGTPLICKMDKAITGYLKEGENGFFFDSDDQFVEKAKKMLADSALMADFKANAEKSAYRFSKECYAESMLSIFLKLESR